MKLLYQNTYENTVMPLSKMASSVNFSVKGKLIDSLTNYLRISVGNVIVFGIRSHIETKGGE